MQSFIFLIASCLSLAYAALYPFQYSSVCTNPQLLSCSNTSSIANTCCSPTPGGLTLVTQFWDTYTGTSSKLPYGAWTTHGLWPDNCNGSYEQYCDPARNYTGEQITSFLLDFGREDLLTAMNNVWINQGDLNSEFWAHEFSKHATCTSTFDTKCYANYTLHEEVIDFFETTLAYYALHPTYDILARGGVVPSNSTTYTLAQLQNAARNATGQEAYFGCSGRSGNKTILNEVWYYGHTLGRVQDLMLVPSMPTGNSTCAKTGIQYPLRTAGTEVNLITGQYV